jgi:hypothetical protein
MYNHVNSRFSAVAKINIMSELEYSVIKSNLLHPDTDWILPSGTMKIKKAIP